MAQFAIPAAKIGGGLVASWLGSKLNKNPVGGGQVAEPSTQTYERSAEGQGAFSKLVGAGDQTMAQGNQLSGPVNNYYRSLISGNRSAMQGAVAPERQQINATYEGAEEGAKRMRGPSRDRALAKLRLQKAGQVGTLPYQARRDAIGAAGQLGQNQTAMAGSLYSRALDSSDSRERTRLGDIRTKEGLALEGARVNLANKENQRQSGSGFGNFFYDLINGIKFGGSGGGGGSVNGLPIIPYQPSISPNRP
jgi:hypothetical protein